MLKQIKKILSFKIGPSINYSRLNPLKFNWEKIKDFSKTGIIIFAFVFLILLTVDLIQSDFMGDDDEIAYEISSQVIDYLDENYLTPEDNNSACNVAGINIHGEITTYIPPCNYDADGNLLEDQISSENIVQDINNAEKNDNIKAIIVEIDSYGGLPLAAEEIAYALKKAKKPTVAYIRSSGISAGYWLATGAGKIFASKNSDIGSIGVTMSYLDNSQKNLKEGLTYNQLSSGKFKNLGDSNKVLTAEERALLMRDINIINQNFIKAVAENRNLDINKVKSLADGSSMLGEMALKNGLIDQIGGMSEAEEYIKEKIGAEVEVCWQ